MAGYVSGSEGTPLSSCLITLIGENTIKVMMSNAMWAVACDGVSRVGVTMWASVQFSQADSAQAIL